MSNNPLSAGGSKSYSSVSTDADPETIRLLTFNTWGLKFVSKHRAIRLRAIADRLAASDYDIVALQEVWCQADWDYIKARCSNFRYSRIFYSGIISGPGLAVLSRFPIESTFLYRFPINGRPSAFFRGDWYVGKGVAVTILKTPTGSVALLNSHMHAPYAQTGDAAYSCHRACQAWDFAQLANVLKRAGYAVVVVGDLNSKPGSLPYRIFEHEAGLSDSWELIHGYQPPEYVKGLSPQDQIDLCGATCDSTLNTWRAMRAPDEACRLDYALVDGASVVPVNAKVDFTEPIPNIGSYSDHFAYSLSFKIAKSEPKASGDPQVYKDLVAEVQTYLDTTAKWQSNWRYLHFLLSLIIVIAFHPVIVVVSFIAPWSSILFQLFSILIAVTGVLNGLIALLFGRSERRALLEVISEVSDRIT